MGGVKSELDEIAMWESCSGFTRARGGHRGGGGGVGVVSRDAESRGFDV